MNTTPFATATLIAETATSPEALQAAVTMAEAYSTTTPRARTAKPYGGAAAYRQFWQDVAAQLRLMTVSDEPENTETPTPSMPSFGWPRAPLRCECSDRQLEQVGCDCGFQASKYAEG